MKRRRLLPLVLTMVVACSGKVDVGPPGGHGGTGHGGTGHGGTGHGGTGGAADIDACNLPEQCTVTWSTCCGTCDEGQIGDVTAVNVQYTQEYRDSLCADNQGCPPCVGWISWNLFAYCQTGQCVAADARVHEVSACSTDADCILRYGLECCPACQSHGFPDEYADIVAVSQHGEQVLQQLMCGPGTVGCQECAPVFPSDVQAVCEQGQCKVLKP